MKRRCVVACEKIHLAFACGTAALVADHINGIECMRRHAGSNLAIAVAVLWCRSPRRQKCSWRMLVEGRFLEGSSLKAVIWRAGRSAVALQGKGDWGNLS